MIQSIEDDTFASLTDLEAIDLSNNALTTIPNELFNLRSLRNLYISGNNLVLLSQDLQRIPKPIAAPIQILSIADCRLRYMPDFGVMPDLWQLNISSNPLLDISVQHFAPFCNLKKLDWNNTDLLGNFCHCQQLTSALAAINVDIEYTGVECNPRYLSSNGTLFLLYSNLKKSC
jgi:Leucine-rich repeat (LRR) protein